MSEEKNFTDELLNSLHNDEDIKTHSFDFLGHKIDIVYVESFTNYTELNENLIKPMLEYSNRLGQTSTQNSSQTSNQNNSQTASDHTQEYYEINGNFDNQNDEQDSTAKDNDSRESNNKIIKNFDKDNIEKNKKNFNFEKNSEKNAKKSEKNNENDENFLKKSKIVEILKSKVIAVGGIVETKKDDDIVIGLCRGEAVIVVDGDKNFVINFALSFPPHRSITEPPTSVVINGPREGFIEDLKINVALIRKRIVSKDLVYKSLEVGRYTKSKIAIMYINSIADIKIAQEIENKLKQINVDGIIDSNYLIDYLSCRPNSLFKQVGKSEKPDIISAKMLEGRIAILVDGSPVVLTLPFILLEDLQNSEDYYEKNYKISFVRFLRFFGVLLAVLLPGFYVAVQLYHFKIVPIKFLVTIVNSTQGIPITPFLEILFVIALFEILYEASIRMPRYLGMALSIVGALILGDTAVRAGIISSPAVMIVALSGITIYTVPEQAGQLSMLRLLFVFAGATLSFFGILCAGLFVLIYLNDFDFYGAPYLSPLSPKITSDQKDELIKGTFRDMRTRPLSFKQKNKTRQG